MLGRLALSRPAAALLRSSAAAAVRHSHVDVPPARPAGRKPEVSKKSSAGGQEASAAGSEAGGRDGGGGSGSSDGGKKRLPAWAVASAIALPAAAGLYAYSHSDEAPFTRRRRLLAWRQDLDAGIGARLLPLLLEGADGRPTTLPKEHALSRVVRTVGRNLVRGYGSVEGMPADDWQFYVLADDNRFSCFALPGGHVFISTGAVRSMRDESELAALLSHEVAHVLARHPAEGAALKLAYLRCAVQSMTDSRRSAETLRDLVLDSSYDETMQREAYFLGLYLLASSCYDLSRAPTLFTQLARGDRALPADGAADYRRLRPAGKELKTDFALWLPKAEAVFRDRCSLAKHFRLGLEDRQLDRARDDEADDAAAAAAAGGDGRRRRR